MAVQVLGDQGKPDEALKMYQEKVLPIELKALGPDHPSLALTYNNIAMVQSCLCHVT